MAHRLDASVVPLDFLKDRTVAVLGYGNQGRAQALNLRDSGVRLLIGQRNGRGFETAIADGFAPVSLSEATQDADILMLTLADDHMGSAFAEAIHPHLREGQTLLFSHGFAIVYQQIVAPEGVKVGLVSPKGQARGVRDGYLAGNGVPALIGVHQGEALPECLAYARACGYSMLLKTTFQAETETDLFGEQAVLCGGMIEVIRLGFETLVEAGYDPELAYFECAHETKLIIDLLVERGLPAMRAAISDTAEFGGQVVGPQVVTEASREAMRQALKRIQSGEFARQWLQESAQGKPNLLEGRAATESSEMEKARVRLFGNPGPSLR